MKEEIVKAIEEDNLVLFVGAGMSMPLGFPSWKSLVKEILIKLKDIYQGKKGIAFDYYIENIGEIDLFEILGELELKKVSIEVKEILYKKIKAVNYDLENLDRHKKLWKISDKIITTNYDKLLDESKPRNVEVFSNQNTFQQSKSIKGSSFLYKIHGDITNPKECILFKSEYEELYKQDNPNTQTLRSFLLNKTILFLGFSLDDPYLVNQLEFINNLYQTRDFKHFLVSNSKKDLSNLNVEVLKVDNWNESFDEFLDELIEVKKKMTLLEESVVSELDIEKIDDLVILQKILSDKSSEFESSNDKKKKELVGDLYKLSDRISELRAKELELNFKSLIPNHKEDQLEYLFNSILNSEKISKENLDLIAKVRDVDGGEYKWFHRSVIVSALTCSIINHRKLDPRKIDLLIDFTNDVEDKVWQKAITSLVLTLIHTGNKWLRFSQIRLKLENLRKNDEIQKALGVIIKIFQFKLTRFSFIDEKVFENDYFKDSPFNYFLPFYEGNSSIDKLYENESIEDVDKLIQILYEMPISDALKYLICNRGKDIIKERENKDDRLDDAISLGLYVNKINEPYLNHINTILNFYKDYALTSPAINNEFTVVKINNFKKHLLDSVEHYRVLGRHFMLNEEWGKAISNYENLIELKSEDIDSLSNLILCYEKVDRNIDDLIDVALKVQKINPSDESNLIYIINMFIKKEDYDKAMMYVEKGLKMNNQNSVYYEKRGSINFMLASSEHGNFTIGDNRIKEYLDSKNTMEDVNRAIELDDNNLEAYYKRAYIRMAQGDYSGVLEDLDFIILKKPERFQIESVYLNRGYAKHHLLDFSGAILEYKKIDKTAKNLDYNYYIKLANSYSSNGNHKEALITIEEGKGKLPEESLFMSTKAAILRRMGESKKAMELINNALSLIGNKDFLRSLLGIKAEIYSSMNKEDEFYSSLEESLKSGGLAKNLDYDIIEKYLGEERFQILLKKYNQTID